jgi:protein ImuA
MMASALLSRRPHRPPPALTLWEEVALPLNRVHEICGPARRTLALRLAARAGAPLIWIAPGRGADMPDACGMAALMDPGEVLFVTAARPADLLWTMEEALKSGAAPVVVAELAEPPGMTPVRRLHLAAEAGAETGLSMPLGLLLTPGTGGAPGIETRWHCAPAHAPGRDAWRLERLRARMLPPKVWRLEDDRLMPEGMGAQSPALQEVAPPVPARDVPTPGA